jgi:hypothetical protein
MAVLIIMTGPYGRDDQLQAKKKILAESDIKNWPPNDLTPFKPFTIPLGVGEHPPLLRTADLD